jgi:hypothetical protein
MSQVNHRALSAVLILCVAMMLTTSVQAQLSFRDSIVQAQKQIRSGTRQVLEEELMLDEEEQAAFWPLYVKFRAEMLTMEERYIDLVSEFVESYQAGELTDEDADRLLDAYHDIQMDALQVRQRYVRHFRKIIPGIKLLRFYQLENKIRAEVDAALALAIPLADPR